jgi:hypothetical protein
MAPPVGPTGLHETCDGKSPPAWQLTAAFARMATTIEMDEAVAIDEIVVTATLGRFITPRMGWSVTAGAIVEGTVAGEDIRSGAALAGALNYLAVFEKPRRPFVSLSLSIGTVLLRAGGDLYSAWDARGGVTVGKTIGERVVPYLAARGFGGPVYWRGDSGGDRYHVTAGGGFVFRFRSRVSVSFEIMPLGERSGTAAVGGLF